MTTAAREERPASPGRERLHAAALRLFAEHGVSGTSLQMIADEVGVTKAAVYHHYKTKDELVVGVIDPFLDRVAGIVGPARARRGWRAQAEAALTGLVDLIVDVRRLYVVAVTDPVAVHLQEQHPRLRVVAAELRELLAGPDADDERRIDVAFFLAGLVGPLGDPRTFHVPDEDLRAHLLDLGRRFLLGRRPARREDGPAG
ncbi:TetR family transcriptional regulator [Kineococcus sp. T13]|uniref:TetR/AcrR family transcriptional regulator n=1 Tax=Kineococcus vitellinus TaxID=2696565 RepID=UPI001413282B|nr:TetR/AcrR family transcriptional regulator [Kineococcus vitellinus]NAZ75932.1 TetR family transcriptional regulator [Kineococcus vitellinus]